MEGHWAWWIAVVVLAPHVEALELDVVSCIFFNAIRNENDAVKGLNLG